MRTFVPAALVLGVATTAVLAGCRKQELAPEAEVVRGAITLDTNGLWHGAEATVQGTARGMESLSIGGIDVPLSGEQFSTTVGLARGVNLLEARGVDARGDSHFARRGVLSGEFRDPGPAVQEAMTVRLNRSGLHKATQLAAGLLDPVAITATATALNPVYEDSYGVLGWDAVNIRADLVDVAFGTPVITPDPQSGVLAIAVSLPDVEVQANATGDIVGIDFDQDLWVGADSADLTANLAVSVVGGELQLDVINPVISLDGFWYDVSLIPGDIESYVLVDTLRGVVEGMLQEQIDALLPGLLEGVLADLDIAFELDLLGRPVSLAADFTSASVDPQGLQLGTAVTVGVPATIDKPFAGYLAAPSAVPTPTQTDDVGLSVSDNLLNNVFFQVWRGGLLEMSLDSANGDIDPFLLSSLGATDAARVLIDADLPPVMIERNGRTEIQITELAVRVETPNGDNGEFIDLSVTGFVGLELRIVEGVLKLELGAPELVLDVRDSDWGASNNAITNLLADQLPVDALFLLLGDIEFPLPSLAGISVNEGDAWREASGVYTTVGLTL